MTIVTGNGTAVSGLGGPAGYGEIMLSRADDASLRVNVGAVFQDGFQFGATHYAANALYVSTNGLVSFGGAVNGVQSNLAGLNRPFIAAFHADVDTRLDGEGPESGPVWVDIDPVSDVVTITWQEVGFYRRNASHTNTFQMQLYDQGEDGIDIVLRYEAVGWTTGDLEGGWNGLGGDEALIGWRLASSGGMTGHWASGNEARLLSLPGVLGNTGVAGLWVYHYQPPKVVNGGSGNDILTGDTGADLIYGGLGDDQLRGLAGADALFGGSGFDLADYSQAASAVTVNLADPSANAGPEAAGDSYFSIEGVIGSGFDDVITGSSGNNRLFGGGGNDRIRDGAGNDTVYGGAGSDTFMAGAGADRYFGGSGYDRLDYGEASAGITLDLALRAASRGIAAGDRVVGIEVIAGTAFDDRLAGTAAQDSFFGMGGNDRLYGRKGADRLFGGAGHDSLTGGGGADLLNGGTGRDLASYSGATGPIRADLARPGENRGDDAVGDRYVSIEGLSGSGFGDVLLGNAAGNRLLGQSGNDRLIARSGADTLEGGKGNDILFGGRGGDRLYGGGGQDTVSYADAAQGVVADLAKPSANQGDARGDRFTSIEALHGSVRGDRLAGDFRANTLSGGAGDDVLIGRGGADRLYGGAGSDLASYQDAPQGVTADLGRPGQNTATAAGDRYFGIEGLRGSAHADLLRGNGAANRLEGGSGDDRLYGIGGNDILQGGAGADRLYGGAGLDLASYATASSGVVAHLTAPQINTGEARGDSYTGIEGLIGSAHDDSLSGGTAVDVLFGGGGQDVLIGGWGNDTLHGDSGADVLKGGAKADLLDGGAGQDWADYASDLRGLIADLANPAANTGDAAGDRYISIECLRGSYHNDRLYGDNHANWIEGSAGNDRLFGRGGSDRLDGGSGADTLTGGTGADTFVIRSLADAGDWVLDYTPNEGDSLEIAIPGLARADLDLRFENTLGQGQPGIADVVILHRPSGQTLFTLVDAGALTDIYLRIGQTSYDLL